MAEVKIVRNPDILGGKPTIEGTRLSVELILSLYAGGWSRQELIDNYPSLTHENINACFAYARDAVIAQTDVVEAAE
jgi:uncharacterized protein (DUF433 family)